MGRLTAKLVTDDREVVGIDLSTEMIVRARAKVHAGLSFLCHDFLTYDFGSQKFDCLITAAAIHLLVILGIIAVVVHFVRRPGGTAR